MAIKNPLDLKLAINLAKETTPESKEYFDLIWDIHKYKWYNWYQNIHIKQDSPEDIENTAIFDELENTHPQIHKDIEKNIEFEIEKMSDELDD